MNYRCPRSKQRHIVNEEICQRKKDRKDHGCVTCSYPKQVARDQAKIADLRVRINLEPKTASQRNNPIEIRGLCGKPIVLSRIVARDLMQKLAAAVNGG